MPELALILGSRGKILGYTLANDVSAWDIERENPLYLPQSKVYTACCALGPVILTRASPACNSIQIRVRRRIFLLFAITAWGTTWCLRTKRTGRLGLDLPGHRDSATTKP